MTTVTIPKIEYKKILKNQATLASKVNYLEVRLHELAQDEFSPEYIKKIERISKRMDAGEGKRFKNMNSWRKYLERL